MALTKTSFMRGMQCPKMLWLDRHKPSLMIIPPEIRARLDAGNDFGDRAMGMFGSYEEMTSACIRMNAGITNIVITGRNAHGINRLITETGSMKSLYLI